MKVSRVASWAAVALITAAVSLNAQQAAAPGANRQAEFGTFPSREFIRTNIDKFKWNATEGNTLGVQTAVLEGDPSKAEPFTVRLRLPNGYKIPPHTHPTTENVTVLTGTFLAGMGTTFIESDLQAFGRDGFASVPANHAHYAMARGLTVVQVHAIGPFILTYVNPADTPKQP